MLSSLCPRQPHGNDTPATPFSERTEAWRGQTVSSGRLPPCGSAPVSADRCRLTKRALWALSGSLDPLGGSGGRDKRPLQTSADATADFYSEITGCPPHPCPVPQCALPCPPRADGVPLRSEGVTTSPRGTCPFGLSVLQDLVNMRRIDKMPLNIK